VTLLAYSIKKKENNEQRENHIYITLKPSSIEGLKAISDVEIMRGLGG